MPHVSSGGGDDLGSTDEVKVYQDEGGEEKCSSENLTEDKLGLVTESEEGKTSDAGGENFSEEGKGVQSSSDVKTAESGPDRLGSLPFPLITPYPYPNGATVPGFGHPSLALQYLYNNDRFASPPPAHMGIPPVHIDPKTGIPRGMYPLHPPPGQFPNPFYPDALNWGGSGYPASSAFRGPYPPLSGSPLSRFSPQGLLGHPGVPPGFPHQALITPGPKQELGDHNHRQHHHLHGDHNENSDAAAMSKKKVPHVKKPLNAFMLFMKEMRAKVIEECALKESAAINQILGRRWHALDRSEQAKYYEMARKEKELHQQLYPGWSARDNYATHNKKKNKRKREPGCPSSPGSSIGNNECTSYEAKKCRARYGLDAQNQWCKPCRLGDPDSSHCELLTVGMIPPSPSQQPPPSAQPTQSMDIKPLLVDPSPTSHNHHQQQQQAHHHPHHHPHLHGSSSSNNNGLSGGLQPLSSSASRSSDL